MPKNNCLFQTRWLEDMAALTSHIKGKKLICLESGVSSCKLLPSNHFEN